MSTIKVGTLLAADGSTTTQPSIPALDTRMAKAWLQFKQTDTQAIRDSYGVSSITDLGVGFTRINFANNLANINYAAVDSYTVQSNISNISSNVTDYLVGSYTIAHRENGSLIDTSRISSIVFGN